MGALRYSEMPTDEAVEAMNETGLVAYENCVVVVDAMTGTILVVIQGSHGVPAVASAGADDGLEFVLMEPSDGRVH